MDIWSVDYCHDLLRWHICNEKHYKRGVNNNLSLLNYSISPGAISYSLLNYRFDLFTPSLMLICPFKAYEDVRGIIRMSTKISSIREHSRWFTRDGDEIIDDERKYIISMLSNRIINGFSWSGNLYNYKIRRYRLNAILSSPNLVLDRNIDVHHLDGLQGICGITDDRMRNLQIMKRDEHAQKHFDNGDMEFVNM